MQMKISIEKPREFYKEVGNLIGLHYNSIHENFDYSKNSFAMNYPVIYGLFLKIAALGLVGGESHG